MGVESVSSSITGFPDGKPASRIFMSATTDTQRTVLVVEDSADDAQLLKFAVRKAVCPLRFRFVHDGEAAIAYLKGDEPFSDRKKNPFPDLVLLDVSLPKVDGFEVLEWIRATDGCESLKVCIWTGWDIPHYVERGRKLGVIQFFLKPSERDGWNTLLSGMVAAMQ
jgi:CheY-like chemotaxis protein